jgi:hypothetical protein
MFDSLFQCQFKHTLTVILTKQRYRVLIKSRYFIKVTRIPNTLRVKDQKATCYDSIEKEKKTNQLWP